MAPEREPSSSSQNSPLLRVLPYILFGAFGVWVLLSKRRAPINDLDEPANTDDPTANESADSEHIPQTSKRRDLNTIPPTNRPPRRTEADDGYSEEGKKRKTPLVQWLIFGATAIYATITLFIYCETKKSADAAKEAADMARLSYRPRLSLLGITPNTEKRNGQLELNLADGRMTVRISVPNTGPFAARNVRFMVYDGVSEKNAAKPLPYQEIFREPKLIPPKVEGGWNPDMIVTGTHKLTEAELSGLKDGTLWATFSILIGYADDIGKEFHHTEFCKLFNYAGGNDICPWPTKDD